MELINRMPNHMVQLEIIVPVAFRAMTDITVKDQLHHVKLVELINRMPDHNMLVMLGQLHQKELTNLAKEL